MSGQTQDGFLFKHPCIKLNDKIELVLNLMDKKSKVKLGG